MPRTLSEILIDADKVDNLHDLGILADELQSYNYHYTLAELNFGKEHIEKLWRKIIERDRLNLWPND